MRKIGMMRSDAVILTSAIRAFRWLSVPLEMISEMWSATSFSAAFRKRLRDVCDLVSELVSAAAELLGLDLETGEPGSEIFLLQGAVLESVEVAVDGLVGLVRVGFNAGQFGPLVVLPSEVLGLGADDGIRDEAVVVAVESAS